MTFSAKILTAAVFMAGSFDILVSHWVIGSNMRHLHAENGLLENLQAVILIMATLAFLAQLFYERPRHYIYPLCGALLGFSFFLREMDVRSLDIPRIFILLGSGIGKKALLTMLWLALIGYGAFNYRNIKLQYFRDLFLEKSACIIFFGGGLLILGGLFDRNVIATSNNQFYEEMLELNGYYMILIGAVLCLRQKAANF